MFKSRFILMGAVALTVTAALSQAQLNGGGGFGGGGGVGGGGRGRGAGGGGGGGGGGRTFGGGRSANFRDLAGPINRAGMPIWSNEPFKSDVFTFVRIIYDSVSQGGRGGGRGGRGGGGGGRGGREPWDTDMPDSDINLPYRLQQMTAMKTEPIALQMRLTDPRLADYPFIYMLEVAGMNLSTLEAQALRKYLLNGGFLMVDDHWGLRAQANLRAQMKRVFPEKDFAELALSHPIFHCVFNIKSKPQVPGIERWNTFQRNGEFDRTYEQPDDPEPNYRALYDDKGRMMMLECANTDLGDGWEREGRNEEYFHKFSEKQAYPMTINIIFYAMTH